MTSATFRLGLRRALRAVLLPAVLASLSAGAGAEDFVFSKKGNVRSVTSATRSWDGQLHSAARAKQPPRTTAHHLSFEFETDDYFRPDNPGHFAIGLRGDGLSDADGDGAPDLRGGGVVLGNVTHYPRHDGCGPTKRPSTIVIEGFWAGGNCIYPRSEGPELRNGQRYRVAISYHVDAGATPARRIRYTLSRRTPRGWERLAAHSADDTMNRSPPDLGGWYFVEVFSTHDWTLRVYNLRDWWS